MLIGFAQQKEYYVNEHRPQPSGSLNGTRCRLHASPCLQGWCSAQRIKISMIAGGNHTLISGRVGIRGTTLDNRPVGRIRRNLTIWLVRIRPGLYQIVPGTANPSPTPPLQVREGMRSETFTRYHSTGGWCEKAPYC